MPGGGSGCNLGARREHQAFPLMRTKFQIFFRGSIPDRRDGRRTNTQPYTVNDGAFNAGEPPASAGHVQRGALSL